MGKGFVWKGVKKKKNEENGCTIYTPRSFDISRAYKTTIPMARLVRVERIFVSADILTTIVHCTVCIYILHTKDATTPLTLPPVTANAPD